MTTHILEVSAWSQRLRDAVALCVLDEACGSPESQSDVTVVSLQSVARI